MCKRTVSVLFALAALPGAAGAQIPVGPEFQVNTYTTGHQSQAHVAVDAEGNFVVVWRSDLQDGSGAGVFARWHDATGDPLGAAEFRVNATTASNQANPRVAAGPDGQVVVAWTGDGQDGSSGGVFARLYSSAIAVPGPEFQVNTFTTGSQSLPSVAIDASGRLVVAWSGNRLGDPNGIAGRPYDAFGDPQLGQFAVNTYTTGLQFVPSVASDQDGRFVMVWESVDQDGSEGGIFARRYDSARAPLGGEFRVNTNTNFQQRRPAIASDPAGNFVVVWNSTETGDYDVWGQRYDAAGMAQGGAFRVNVYTTGTQNNAAVASAPDGSFVVVWRSDAQDGSGRGVFGRHFDSAGAATGGEFQLSSHTLGDQTYPAVATDAQGDFVTAWASALQDGSGDGVFVQRFQPDLIFRDGVEDGTLDAWSASSTDGGDLSVSALAGMNFTTAGLRGVVDDTTGLYVQDDRPRDEGRYRARFYFDPNGFDPGESQGHLRTRIFIAFSEAPARRLAAIVLRRQQGAFAIRARGRLDDDTQVDTPFFTITDEPHLIEVELGRDGAPGAPSGYLALAIDGHWRSYLLLDNSLSAVDFVRMGALSVKAGASGEMYWDEFESRRPLQPIGP